MTGARPDAREVEEAKRWFRENPAAVDHIGEKSVHEHAATIVRAALAPGRRMDVGRCGNQPPRSPLYGCTTLTTVCELDAGHAGWHRDGTTEWGRVVDPAPTAPTVFRAEDGREWRSDYAAAGPRAGDTAPDGARDLVATNVGQRDGGQWSPSPAALTRAADFLRSQDHLFPDDDLAAVADWLEVAHRPDGGAAGGDTARAIAQELRWWALRMHPLGPLTDDMFGPEAGACRWRDSRRLEVRAEQLDPGGEWPGVDPLPHRAAADPRAGADTAAPELAPQMVVGSAGVPIDAYDAIQLLAARPDHPSRLLAETARKVADWWNDPPTGVDCVVRDEIERMAPSLAVLLWELLGGGPGDVSDARPASGQQEA